MKTNNTKKIVVSVLALAMGAGLAGSISGSVAWYQYSTRATAQLQGVSTGTSRNLKVRIADGDYDQETGDWEQDLTSAMINTYLGIGGDGQPAALKLNPVTIQTTGNAKDAASNVHPGLPYTGMKELGARGIGLYRSEYLWLDRELEPTEEEQFNAYSEAVIAAREFGEGSVCVIRTLDLGGDKLVKGISSKEANPFLGQRSIRYLLTHRDVFKRQLRAILRASAFGPTAILYPMISCPEELREAAVELESTKRELANEGLKFDPKIPVGAMIEVPAAALSADDLARQVDFFSIGTNDLVQYTMAADRGNESVSYLYQPLNRAVIKLIRMTVSAAKAKGIHVTVCGESASDPVIGTYWVAVGVDTLSMSATYIPGVSRILSRLSTKDLDEYAKVPDELPPGSTGAEVFNACHEWLAKKLPDLGDLIA